MKRILITGHRGFIGSYLVKELKGKIIGLDIKEGNDILTCKLPKNIDIVIHLAAQTKVIDSMTDPIADAEANILGTIRLVQHYKDAKFIFASSGGAIQEKIESAYGLSKFCAEYYIKMFSNNYVILRFANIFGVGSNSVVEKFINKDIKIFGDGSSTRDYVYIHDLVRAVKQSLHWKQGTYSLGSTHSVRVLALAKATGKPIKFLPKIEGELQHSRVRNNSTWKPTVNVIKYIKKQCTTSQS